MNKNFIDDIRPKHRAASMVESGEGEMREARTRGGRKRLLLALSGVVFVVAVLLLITNARATATVKVTPIQQVVTVDHIFAATQKATEGPGIIFDRLEISDAQSVSVPATGMQGVKDHAKGMLTVFNESSQTQRLLPKTRFQSKNGKIYRTDRAVAVPPARNEGGTKIAGTIETVVVADSAGVDGNLPAETDFTIPGLAGSALFKQVYGKAKTAISGGFVGEKLTASAEDMASAETKLKAELTTRLLEKAKGQTPEGAILYDDATFITFTSNRDESASADSISLQMKADFVGFFFRKNDLASAIAERTSSEAASSSIEAIGLEKLSMRILGKSSLDPIQDVRFSFSIQGNLKLVWRYDVESLRKTLADVERSRYQEIFRSFPMIERAEATFRPKWRRTFPSNPEKITIETIISP